MDIITAINGKGGVGKTETVKDLAYEFAAKGKRVLVVDADSDCCLTDSLYPGTPALTLYDVLTESAQGIARAVLSYRGSGSHQLQLRGSLDLVAGSMEIAKAAKVFNDTRPRQPVQSFNEALNFALAKDGQYDTVFLDPGPNWDAITEAVLWTATAIIIPVTPEALAIKALKRLLTRINTINQTRAHPARNLGVVMSKIVSSEQLDLAAQLRSSLQAAHIPVFATNVPFSDHVWRAAGEFLPVGAYTPDDPAALAFKALAREIEVAA